MKAEDFEYLYEHKDGILTCLKCQSVVYLDFCPNDKCSNFKIQAGPRPQQPEGAGE